MAHSCEFEFFHQLKGRLVITSRTPGIHLSQNHRNQFNPLQHDYQWHLKPISPMVHYVVLPPCFLSLSRAQGGRGFDSHHG